MIPMNSAAKPTGTRRRWLVVLPVAVLVLLAGPGSHAFARSAPPLVRAVDLVEKSPNVTDVVGSPASVSLTVTRRLRRNVLQAISGEDSVSVLSTVKGPKGEAEFRLEARNVKGQGWAGTFAVEAPGRSVLKEGKYTTEGGGVALQGEFDPDGAPRISKKP
jgi:hypothetical protein